MKGFRSLYFGTNWSDDDGFLGLGILARESPKGKMLLMNKKCQTKLNTFKTEIVRD